ncbi:LysR family transcriptional regulator [Jannaschia sp. 2305UL9-9]|uniref:LysR family transcriptional regulator n=1 Tax=Jannaschia sp. 2305UL9-9 TaxID=3121638 RepID=UPI0035293CC4
MHDDLPWADLALFAAVARCGTLAGAASETGASTATLSRRMTALETRIGRRLFHHGAQGYAITQDGAALLVRAERMEDAAADIARWRTEGQGPTRVRISAGTWTAQALARDVRAYWSPDAKWVPDFVHADADLDIARRQIDIGIRNRRPEQPWLAGRRTGQTEFAVYGVPSAEGFIGPGNDAPRPPSARWLLREHGDQIVTTANDPRLALALAEAGVGRVVLPCFAGDRSALTRLSGPIAELTCEEWLVSHHDGRHATPVRAALDALFDHLSQNRALVPDRVRD